MAVSTAGVLLLTGVGPSSGYSTFVLPFVLLGIGVGVSLSPCADTIMGCSPSTSSASPAVSTTRP